jgi:tetratricopeptide (TPR) repeat protein
MGEGAHRTSDPDLGPALLAQRRFGEAESWYRRILAARPGDAQAHANLGYALHKLGRTPEAVASYLEALRLDPGFALAHGNLGTLLRQEDRLEEAILHFRAALVLRPDYLAAHNNLGLCLRRTGRLAEARSAFEAALALRPDMVEAHCNLATLKTYREGDPQVDAFLRLEARLPAMTPLDRIRYAFTRGKMLEDLGRFDEAFAAYAEGNRLKRARMPWSEAPEIDRQARLVAAFGAERFRTPVPPESGTPVPVFIVGMPRSGTSLIEQVLASLPGVCGAGELTWLSGILAGAGPFPEALRDASPEAFRRLGEGYLARIRQLAPGATHVTDKMPANHTYVGLIHLMLPGARIIHARRDPMDSCFSCFARLFEGDHLGFAYDLGSLGRTWIRYHDLMAHWEAVLPPGRVLDLDYETMVADPEGEARRLLEYLGLPWDPRCLAFHENPRPVGTASVAQVRRPLYQTSVARWKRFERHLDPLLEIVQPFRANRP